jgi:hypothetical protein
VSILRKRDKGDLRRLGSWARGQLGVQDQLDEWPLGLSILLGLGRGVSRSFPTSHPHESDDFVALSTEFRASILEGMLN